MGCCRSCDGLGPEDPPEPPEATCKSCGAVWYDDETTIVDLNGNSRTITSKGFWSGWVEDITPDERGNPYIVNPSSCPACEPWEWE